MRLFLLAAAGALLLSAETLEERTQRYFIDLLRINTSNGPGNETQAAQYIQRELEKEGIPSELLGGDPNRLNVIARLKAANPTHRPLLLMAHSDVVPIEPKLWTVPAFDAVQKDGFIYGRGAVDTKSLVAAEMAAIVELKRRNSPLNRDIIFLSEADEEAGSTGIQWLIRNAWAKIDAEFCLNEAGARSLTEDGAEIFQIQTSEKVPTRVILVARGSAGHGSLPRKDNAVAHLSDAISKLTKAYMPVQLNTTTRRYFHELSKLEEYKWLQPMLPGLENKATLTTAANAIGDRDAELDAQFRTTVSPTILRAGMKVNVIPNQAEAQLDVRRLPGETKEEVYARFRQIINDPAIDVLPEPGQDMPATEPSSLTTDLYKAIETAIHAQNAKAAIIPYMSRGATDGAFLRAKGMAVYGVPVFMRDDKPGRAHGNDERIRVTTLREGAALFLKIVETIVLSR
ncbi:MAG TPA: M20/M25/M40 family metallo-hydrolase [Bryobacteraceae bacterium]|nr:M20/M25/M40 family metallo-hydrolase [Bryobacteraceae bacterium]